MGILKENKHHAIRWETGRYGWLNSKTMEHKFVPRMQHMEEIYDFPEEYGLTQEQVWSLLNIPSQHDKYKKIAEWHWIRFLENENGLWMQTPLKEDLRNCRKFAKELGLKPIFEDG